MGILTKEVELCTSPMHLDIKEMYKNLGYDVFNLKTILVDVSHLSKGSGAIIKVECDKCKTQYNIKYKYYSKINHSGKIYCKHCSNSIFCSRENHPMWNSNKTEQDRELGRKIDGYDYFIKGVLKRDDYICQCCGIKTENLKVHHLDGYEWCKEKRVDISNGITLCENCHKTFHFNYGYGGNTKSQFEEWIGRKLSSLHFNYVQPDEKKIFCIEEGKVYRIDDFCKEKKVIRDFVVRACNKKSKSHCVGNFHLAYLDDYKKMSNSEINDYVTSKLKRKVVCLETGEVFESLNEAARKYNVSASIIGECCRGKCTTVKKMHWAFLSDYEKMTHEEKENIKQSINNHYKKVICIETKEVFMSIMDAAEKYKVQKANISACCRGVINSVNKQHWMFLTDYEALKDKFNISFRTDKKKKAIICIEKNERFSSITEAAKKYRINRDGINSCCLGIQHTCGGYHWKYVNKNEGVY